MKIKSVKTNGKKSSLTQVLGPVQNLESHLKPDWWRRIFNSMYLKTDADVVDDKEITRNEIDYFLELLKLPKDSYILDLACGQGRHTLELARRGYSNVFGLDRSHYLIKKAKAIADNEGLSISFKEGDARKLPFSADMFDVVLILGNSFGYFESKEDDLKVLREVFRIIKPFGRFLMDVADGNYLKQNFNPRSWEWIDNKHFVCRERSLAQDGERLISREVISNTQKGVIVDQFYAERLYTKDDLNELLNKSGFSKIEYNTGFEVMSTRNQDLGMMERRHIVTSQVIKEWTPVKKKVSDQKNVIVLMGDPTLPDIVKPDSHFDTDDFNTIKQLKIALSELKEYKFTFLDNHNSLFNDLQKIRPKCDLVLNLCDEGYKNDARKELHVPAILELFNIHYTGSNPQCLAYCYDKSLVRGIAQEMNIPVPDAFFIKADDNVFELNLEFPLIVKPNYGDSSFGITQDSVVHTVEELDTAILRIRNKFGYDKPILVEEFLMGKEVTVGIIGNITESYVILPIIEEDYSLLPDELPKICGYEAKWIEDSPYFKLLRSIKANLSAEAEKVITESCLKLFERLECRDYARFDWRLDKNGVPRLLEVNPNPGWCWDGHLAKMSKIYGWNYADMLKAIINAAEKRIILSGNRNVQEQQEVISIESVDNQNTI